MIQNLYRLFFLLLIFFPLFLFPCSGSAQTGENTEGETEKVVRVVRFSGNEEISTRELKNIVRTENNREFLGIPRFTPWYFLWRTIRVGESPSYLNREVLASDLERVKLYYDNQGFFDAEVDTTVIEFRENRVEVSFIIREGPQSMIRSVSYSGLPKEFNDQQRERFYSESVYAADLKNDSTFSVNRKYRTQGLRSEQSRIINFLKNNGYASVQRDSVRALIKPRENEQYQYDVLFSIKPGRLYKFGDMYINLAGPDSENVYEDTLVVSGEPATKEGYSINIAKQQSAQTRFDLLTEQIRFTPGEPFDQSAYLQSFNSFQNLGIMSINRFGLSEEGSMADFSQTDIPVYFDLQTIPKHSLRAELFGMRRYGFGTGFGVNYNNNNLTGRADNFTLGVNTSLEFVGSGTLPENFNVSGSTIFQSYEVRAEYTLPKLTFPFRLSPNRSWIQSSRTRYAVSYNQSNQLFFDINSDIRFNMRFEVTHTDRYTSLFDLVEMNVIDAELSTPFRQNLADEFGENSVEFLRIEEDFRPQYSSIIRYTFRSRNTDIIKRNYGHSFETAFAVGGNVPYLLDRYVFGAGDVSQTLPSPFGISSNDLAYSRFIKYTADYRRYISLSPNTVFSVRGFAGIAQPIFQSDSVPLSRRFFAGGSNDIRGWNAFQLGPGGIASSDVTVQGGEIKLASFAELRQTIIQNFINGKWVLALHTDAGNIWYGPRTSLVDEFGNELLDDGRFYIDNFYNQVAVGSGYGIRIDWDFLVARFDVTYRVNSIERGWFNDSTPYFSFGIGHAF